MRPGYVEYRDWSLTSYCLDGEPRLYSRVLQGRVPFLRRHMSQALTRFFFSPFFDFEVASMGSLSLQSSGEDIVCGRWWRYESKKACRTDLHSGTVASDSRLFMRGVYVMRFWLRVICSPRMPSVAFPSPCNAALAPL